MTKKRKYGSNRGKKKKERKEIKEEKKEIERKRKKKERPAEGRALNIQRKTGNPRPIISSGGQMFRF